MEKEKQATGVYRSIYTIVEDIRQHGLVIYGAGFWGKITYRIFSLFELVPLCFCDDAPEKQRKSFQDKEISIPVLSLDQAAHLYPEAVYISAVSGHEKVGFRSIMNHRLKERGLYTESSGFHPFRYIFLLEKGWEALQETQVSAQSEIHIEDIHNMIVLNHMSNSGAVYFDSLLNGHPNILNIPELGARVRLKWLYENRIKYLEGKELVVEIASQMFHYFESQFPEEKYMNGGNSTRIAYHWFKNKDGERETRIYIDTSKFIKSLKNLLLERGKISFAVFIKAIYAAYANAIGKLAASDGKLWIFYDCHKANYDISEMDTLLNQNDFERLEYWFIIREPIQHLFSILRRHILEADAGFLSVWNNPSNYLDWISSDLGLMLEKNKYTENKIIKVVRFEDAKLKTLQTMKAVCEWMQIPFDQCMLNTTINGIEVYFPASASGEKKGTVIASNDTTSVERKDFSSLFSSFDLFRLSLIFHNFKESYGYRNDIPNYTKFSFECLKELFQYPFKFESTLDSIALNLSTKSNKYVASLAPSHDPIIKLFLEYVRTEKHELITDIIWPLEN
ncbi:MAG: hypothetical protein IKL51_01895 [Lachnospiraceae bacterium]|nr:hypothetical protein [Lachnospiraceae bacterium]